MLFNSCSITPKYLSASVTVTNRPRQIELLLETIVVQEVSKSLESETSVNYHIPVVRILCALTARRDDSHILLSSILGMSHQIKRAPYYGVSTSLVELCFE